jgi:PadR family transcriptional regulator PadR
MNTGESDEQWIAQLRKGSLEMCMLALLMHSERYGYEIAQALSESAGLAVSEGTIYPLLLRLQREGLVSSRWHESPAGPPRKYYRLTPSGSQDLEVKAATWERFAGAVNQILQEVRNGQPGG